jgi:hypothetical protein
MGLDQPDAQTVTNRVSVTNRAAVPSGAAASLEPVVAAHLVHVMSVPLDVCPEGHLNVSCQTSMT